MEKIKVLIFAANPPGTDRLDLGREFREIDEEVRHGEYRDSLEVIFVPGARPKDLLRKLNKERPQVVHFSGHGSGDEIIFLEQEDENQQDAAPTSTSLRSGRDMKVEDACTPQAIGPPDMPQHGSQRGLAEVLRSCDAGNIQVVVLNACHTRFLAAAIGETIDCVVSMEKEISDRSAIRFAASFYGALAFGHSVQRAFDQAVARLKVERTFEELTPTLLVRQGVNAEKLVLLGSSLTGSAPVSPDRESPFTVPFPRNADFFGRDEDLERLHASLAAQRPVGIRPSGLTGMGGIGKTQLAVEYAYRYRAMYVGGIYWINAAEPLVEGFAALGCRFRSELMDRSRDEQVRAAFGELNRPSQVLVILDNLTEPSLLNRPVAPGSIPSALLCHILFTTRRRDLGRFGAIEVTVLPEESALRLLLRHPDRQPILDPVHPEHEDARAICRDLGRLPLALELAGAFLGDWLKIPLADYRMRLRNEGILATLDDEAAELSPALLPAVHEAAVTATLSSQWDALADETARLMLRVAGQLPEAAAIPLARLGLLAGVGHRDLPAHPSPLARAFKRLENACLVEGLFDNQLRLHLLIREYANKKTPKEHLREFRRTCAEHVLESYSHFSILEENAQHRGIDAIQEDLICALEFCPDNDEIHGQLELLVRLLQQESHHLLDCQKQGNSVLFAQQIHNRAVALNIDSLALEAKDRLAQLRRPHALLLWRVSRESPALIRTFTGHRSWVNAVVFTPDGRHALSGSDDHTMSLWDLRTCREVRTFVGHQGRVDVVVLGLDGRHALSGSSDQKLKLWDLGTGRELLTLSGHQGSVTTVALTPNGQRALSGSADGTVRLWDLQTGMELRTFLGHLGGVTSVAITCDGHAAISGANDATIRFWDLRSGQALRIVSGHVREVTAVAITPDGQHVLSVSDDKTLKVWDLQSGQESRTFTGMAGWITAITVMPDARHILSASDDCVLRLWDLETGAEVRRFVGHSGRVNAVDVSRDGRYAVSGSDDLTLKLWNLQSVQDSPVESGHRSRVNAVAITPDGSRAISASNDQTLKLWDIGTGREQRTFVGHSSLVTAVAIKPDGRSVLSGSYDGLIKDWSIETGEERQSFHGHEGGVMALTILPNRNLALSGSADRAVKLWDLATGEELRTLIGHADRVTAVTVSADGQHALSSSDDGSLLWWELGNGESPRTLSGQTEVWKTPQPSQGRLWGSTRGFYAHTDVVTTTALSSDGTLALSGSSDRTLKIWDLRTGESHLTLRGHVARVNAAVLTRDARRAVSISEDGTLRVWDLETGRCVLIVPIDSPPSALALAPDDATVVVGDSAGRLYGLRLVHL
jgi:WD40 repeat protein